MGERTVTTTTGEPRRSLMEHGQSMGERSLTTTTPHMIFSSDESAANQPQLAITS